jgi:hypothetical protein
MLKDTGAAHACQVFGSAWERGQEHPGAFRGRALATKVLARTARDVDVGDGG